MKQEVGFYISLCVTAAFSQVHAYIITSLKKEMPSVFGKENKKKELISNLGAIYEKVEREHNISPGDFPNLKKMQVMWLDPGLEKHYDKLIKGKLICENW